MPLLCNIKWTNLGLDGFLGVFSPKFLSLSSDFSGSSFTLFLISQKIPTSELSGMPYMSMYYTVCLLPISSLLFWVCIRPIPSARIIPVHPSFWYGTVWNLQKFLLFYLVPNLSMSSCLPGLINLFYKQTTTELRMLPKRWKSSSWCELRQHYKIMLLGPQLWSNILFLTTSKLHYDNKIRELAQSVELLKITSNKPEAS